MGGQVAGSRVEIGAPALVGADCYFLVAGLWIVGCMAGFSVLRHTASLCDFVYDLFPCDAGCATDTPAGA